MRVYSRSTATFLLLALAACGSSSTGPTPAGSDVPLNDLGPRDYLGMFEGGLYPGGLNTMPAAHDLAGQLRARNIQPLDGNGAPSPNGKYVLLSIGMSHATQDWCAVSGACNPWTFTGKATADGAVNQGTLVIANGAEGGETALFWD